MKKTMFKTILAAASLAAVAGTAGAQDINIYGASAEFNFWKGAGIAFLQAAAPAGLGCGTVSGAIKDPSGKSFIIVGSGCSNSTVLGADTNVNFRVANKASYDGIFAVTNSSDSQGTPCGGANNARSMANAAASDTQAVDGCNVVTLGASDVPANAFVQKSSGPLQGPLPSGTQASITRVFNNGAGVDTAALGTLALNTNYYQPVKVPFGFFLTSNVKAKTCNTLSPTPGDFCNADIDCGSTGTPAVPIAGSCNTTSAPVSNITREMVTELFHGTLANWSSFAGFDSLPVTVCVRHAGSGSHATIDLALMNKAWGAAWPASSITNKFWYNDSTGDLLNCMREAQATTKTGRQTTVTGAIGYADADTDLTNGGLVASGVIYGPLKYNGTYPNAQNIISGVYDLYADQTLYLAPTANTANSYGVTQKAATDLLMSYLNDSTGSHLNGTSFRNFWAAAAEMKVGRSGNPFSYPVRGGQ
jgi:hypothetical protein